ncbi:MAG: ABC1 kinase family protein [Planctomycetota bacterium]
MSILEIGRGPRKVQRLTEIAAVLVRHGLTYVVDRLNLHPYLPKAKQLLPGGRAETVDRAGLPRRLTLAMEALGPTFVRLGQLLSSRPDLVPEDFVHEFERLQDRVAPFPSDQARQIIEAELDGSVEDLFGTFERDPVASGSLAQVHYATLADGTEVVVKVQRPGIEDIVFTDLSLLRPLAEYAERHVPELAMFQPTKVLDELERTIRRELDFITEASNTARFEHELQPIDGVRCPRVYWEQTSSRVLTLERLRGERITDVGRLDELGVDRPALAVRLVDSFLKQYLEMGTFHGDPHPGNMFVEADGTIGLVDFGSVGRLTPALQERLGALLVAVSGRDVEVVTEICFSLGVMGEDVKEAAFKLGVTELLDKYYGMPLKRIDPRRVFGDVTALARESHILLPQDFVLLAKSLVQVISIARELDPNFDVAALLRPRAREMLLRRLAPGRLAKSAGLHLWSLSTLLTALPRSFLRILRRTESGRLEFTMRHVGYEDFARELDRAANRLTVGLILASLVIGSSVLLAGKIQPYLYGEVSFLGVLGYVFAGILGLWTVWGILRSGRL